MYSQHSGKTTKHVSFLDSQDESGIELFSDFENSTENDLNNLDLSTSRGNNFNGNHSYVISSNQRQNLVVDSPLKSPQYHPVSILKKPSCREKTKWPFQERSRRRRVADYDEDLYYDDYNYTITDEPVFTFQGLVALCVFIISFTAFCLLTCKLLIQIKDVLSNHETSSHTFQSCIKLQC